LKSIGIFESRIEKKIEMQASPFSMQHVGMHFYVVGQSFVVFESNHHQKEVLLPTCWP